MLKRTVATLASAAVLALLITPSAEAAGPDKLSGYAAGASGTALAITLLDQEIAFGTTSAAVSSEGPDDATDGPLSAADGAALLVAGTPVPSGAPSQTPGGQPQNSVEVVNLDLGTVTGGAADGLALALAKVDTAATVTDGAPAATSEADGLVINVNGLSGTVLSPILTPLTDALTAALTEAEETLLCGDGGLLLELPGVCDTVNDVVNINELVDEIIARIGDLDDGLVTVAQLRVSPTLSNAAANDVDGVVASAGSTGVFIELFPGLPAAIDEIVGEQVLPDVDVPSSLLTLSLGNAQAEVTRDPVDGTAKAVAEAAQLLGIDVTDSLGLLSDLLEVEVPNLVDSLAEAGAALSCDGGALADLICIDLGTENPLDAAELEARGYSFGKGTVGTEATAAGIAILPILGELLGGESVLGLQLAQASAAANAIPAPADQPEAPRGPLPRTGGTPSLPVVLGLFGAAAVGVAGIRRTRTV